MKAVGLLACMGLAFGALARDYEAWVMGTGWARRIADDHARWLARWRQRRQHKRRRQHGARRARHKAQRRQHEARRRGRGGR